MSYPEVKQQFKRNLSALATNLPHSISTEDEQWTVKGFVDVFRNVYTISGDTKIVSKILEIHLLPKILAFAADHDFIVVLAEHQNYYPDVSFVSKRDERIKFAVDFKTTYRLPDKPHLCNGFTLGSHGEYFVNRTSRKNIQFPYNEYLGHFCLGIIYSRYSRQDADETRVYGIDDLQAITSVISNFQFFAVEKWEIASDSSGSGNTANIGSVKSIDDLVLGNGVFKRFGNDGEKWFDDFWCNYGKITVLDNKGQAKKIRSLKDFLVYRGYEIPAGASP
jgi:hypothetical protein